MKKMEWKNAYKYEAPGHFDVTTLRLHGKEESGAKKILMGLSHFLPGGGCDMGATPTEKIYYVLEGEITIKTDAEDIILKKNDSIFIGPGENRAIINNTNKPVSMLVSMNYLD